MSTPTFGPALKTVAVLLLTAAGIGGYVLWQDRRSEVAHPDSVEQSWVEQKSAEQDSEEALAKASHREAAKPGGPPLAAAAGGSAAKPPDPSSAKPLEDPTPMAKLRELTTKDPESALRLAKEANERFPNSQDAAERAWIVVKSLDNLKRFHEGQAEARIMVERYKGTSWAADVERHTLVYPLDQPSREQMQARERERSQPH